MKDEIADCIHTKEIHQGICIQDITLGFAHLTVPLKQPGMAKYLLWQRNIKSHQENRPVNCMEADNILTDQVKVCRP